MRQQGARGLSLRPKAVATPRFGSPSRESAILIAECRALLFIDDIESKWFPETMSVAADDGNQLRASTSLNLPTMVRSTISLYFVDQIGRS